MSLDQLAGGLAPKFVETFHLNGSRPCRIFLSATDMKSRAITRHASAVEPAVAFNDALNQLRDALGSSKPTILRADWVTDVEAMTWEQFGNLLGSTARNEFNRGVALQPDFSVAFTALELNANQMLALADNPNGAFNLKNAADYARARFGRDLPTLEPSSPIAVFNTAGLFVLEDGEPLPIDGAEHRAVTLPNGNLIREIIQSAVQYLERQLLPGGRFIYGRLPCTDRFVSSYDAVNHFATVLAMTAAFDLGGRRDERLSDAIDRAIKFGVETYALMLSEEKLLPLKAALEGFSKNRTVPEMRALLPLIGLNESDLTTEAALLDEYMWTETAMFFKRPEMILGGFFERAEGFRVQIGDVARALLNLAVKFVAITIEPSVQVAPLAFDASVQIEPITIAPSVQPAPRSTATIFFGGDIILGRRMHLQPSSQGHFGEIAAMKNADVRIASLMSMLSSVGEKIDKGYFYYFRGRPELTNILTAGKIDVVLTANHHAFDYGTEAMIDQSRLLDRAGIAHVGLGANVEEASAPIYVKANDLTLALFAVDATTEQIAATDERAGVYHLPLDDPKRWRTEFEEKIAEARKHADIVFVAIDWEPVGFMRSFDRMKAIAHALIDSGADGVLGCDSFWFNRVEKYNERPIIYGAGLMLFDGADGDCGGYSLELDADGVKRLNFSALRRGNCKVWAATSERTRMNNDFLTRCREFGTAAVNNLDGTISVTFNPPPRSEASAALDQSSVEIIDPKKVKREMIEPLNEPRSEWAVERVPDDAIIKPQQLGGIKLVGYRLLTPVLNDRVPVFVETYWTIDQPVTGECRFFIEGKSVVDNGMPFFGEGDNHEFEDWQFPVERWKPGVIYREKFGLRPPSLSRCANVELRIEIRVRHKGQWFKAEIGQSLVKMQLPQLPLYRHEFPSVIEQSEPGKCWTAEQLAAVTGGKWIVEPPEGWYVQSVVRDMRFYERAEKPLMFVATRRSNYLFHTGGDKTASTYDNHSMLGQYADKIAGAMIDHEVEGLPTDLPLLLVEDTVKASIELGFAARRRFRGTTIAVSGDTGKTTTVKLLEHVLKAEGEVIVPFGSEDAKLSAPTTFASAKADAAYAIIEVSKEALSDKRGSITGDLMPDVAIVTSNFGFDKDSEAEAKIKSRVFDGMSAGGHAILNRDMKHYAIFEAAAKRHGLNVITFGRHADSMIRMPDLKSGGSVFINGAEHKLDVLLSGDQLYNALAVLAVVFVNSHGGGASGN